MTTAREFRQRARETLGGGIFKSEWIYALLVSLIASLVLGVSGYLVVVVFILSGPIQMGVCRYYVGRVRGNIPHDDIGSALDGFKGDIGGNIVTGLLTTLYTVLWTLLFIIPGIVKSFSYSMAYYIKLDHPEYSATQAIDESRRLMNGNKWRLFCLRFSFIGWMIVGALCLGVGILWVNAYMQAADAHFYQELIANDVITNITAASEVKDASEETNSSENI